MEDLIKIKCPYVCGPLTELPSWQQESVKSFYTDIADVCQNVLGVRAFVPHEHFDPALHANFSPQEVDESERRQVCELTSCLIVVAIAPSWGGGIEVEMAYRSGVPIIILCEQQKIKDRKISRLLRGNPGVKAILAYKNKEQALELLGQELTHLFS